MAYKCKYLKGLHDYCLSLKYALKLSFHIKCPGKVSGHAGKNAHDMFFLPKSCTSKTVAIDIPGGKRSLVKIL